MTVEATQHRSTSGSGTEQRARQQPVIETEGLTREFGELTAVDALDLTVESGEVFGFLGPNGAGKSTTINMLLGFLEPTDGHARILGTDVSRDPASIRQRIGLLPEGFDPLENLSAREHVQSAIETKGADDDPDEIIERVGLDPEDARRPAGDYSKGMTQRLALGIALVGDPDLLILDEPSGGLDPNGVKLLREIVREECERGATVFFSSHVLDEVERVCDRVAILRDGQLTAVNSVENLRSSLDVGSTVEASVDEVPDVDLGSIDGVTDVTTSEGTISVDCKLPEAKMPALRRIDDAAEVTDVQIHDATLESVFEEYTSEDADATNGGAGQGVETASDEMDSTADRQAAATTGGD